MTRKLQNFKNWHIVLVGLFILSFALSIHIVFQERLRGLTTDILQFIALSTWQSSKDENSTVSAILIDEATHSNPDFSNLPRVMWTPKFATILDNVMKDKNNLVGLDVILPTTAANWAADKAYDRSFMQMLRNYGHDQQRLILGEVYINDGVIRPYKMFSHAVGGADNVLPLNVQADIDGIIRKVPETVIVETPSGEEVILPSFASELTQRAQTRLTSQSHTATSGIINFDPTHPIEVHSFASLMECATQQNQDFFQQNFDNKVVLIGLDLAVEDRALSTNRFSDFDNATPVPDCNDQTIARTNKMFGTAGVLILANAINNNIYGNSLTYMSDITILILLGIICLFCITLGIRIKSWKSILIILISICGMTVLSVFLRQTFFYILPLTEIFAVAFVSYLCAAIFRNLILDRERRKIHKLFSHYLDPVLIKKMAKEGASPKLGGETRMITMMFTDLEGFSRISEATPPETMVQFLNEYFGCFEAIVKKNGGIIERFVGDALVAMYGSPIDDPDHAKHAVKTALEAQAALLPISKRILGQEVITRFGVNSGRMTVGNIGAKNRVTYTAMGDGANLAARLESANKQTGSTILIGETTYALCKDDFDWRFINTIQVVGRDTAIDIYEPITIAGETPEHIRMKLDAYTKAVTLYQQGNFEAAEKICTSDPLVEDKIAQQLAQYCQRDRNADHFEGILKLYHK